MISSEDIEKNGLPYGMVDTFVLYQGPIVVNTDTSNNGGIHWFVLAQLPDNSIYMFDPLGPKNLRRTSDGHYSDHILKHRLEGMLIHKFPYQIQHKSSTLCGWYSIYIAQVIRTLLNEFPKLKHQQITAAIESQFGRKPSQKDIDILKRVFH